MTQQYGSLLVPPRAASNCGKGVSILYLFSAIYRKIEVYLVYAFLGLLLGSSAFEFKRGV